MSLLPDYVALFVAARHRAAHVAEAAALFVVMQLFAWLSVDRASALGAFVARSIMIRSRYSERARRNLKHAMPENSDAENRRIISAMWDNLGRAVAEYPHLAEICARGSGRVEVVNGGVLAALQEDQQPGIVFGGHFGNWEVGPVMIHQLVGPSLLSVYRAANNPLVDGLMRRMRGRGSQRAVPKGAEGGREVLRHLRRGGHLGILVDQKLNDGIAAPFFGHQAMTAPAIARLGLRFACPLVPARLERLAGVRFRLTVQPPIWVEDTGDAPHDVLAAMTGINSMIESWVRSKPEQWLWVHRRWPH